MSNSNLTQKQWDVVNEYMTNDRNKVEAIRTCLNVKDPHTAAYKYFSNPKIKEEIAKREDDLRRISVVSEADVLERMWAEATNTQKGAQHSARIAALVKYADWKGYFKSSEGDDEDSGGTSIYITNYSDGHKTVAHTTKKAIEKATPEELEEAEEIAGVEIKRYD